MRTRAPLVLDAEALRSMATLGEWWAGTLRSCVLTPHPGEFARLRAGAGVEARRRRRPVADDDARLTAATAAAAAWGQVVVLKGAKTVIAEPDGTSAVAPFENPALASGGTGDVLSGVIGALLAQGMAPGPAARLGVYLHGAAGDMVRDRLGDAGLLASDLPDALPIVRKRLAAIAERSKPALVGQRVLDPRRDLGECLARHDALLLQRAQAQRERARRDAGQGALELAEARAPLGEITDHQQGPLAADDVRGTADGTVGVRHAEPSLPQGFTN